MSKLIGPSIGGNVWGLFGGTGFFLSGVSYDVAAFALFLFQMVFMDTALTIPTGSMAERWKLSAFVIYGLVVVGGHLSPLRLLGLGRRLALDARQVRRPRARVRRLRRLRRRPPDGRRDGADRRVRPRPAHRQVREGRGAGDSRPQPPDGRPRLLHPRVRLVRLQRGLDARGDRPEDLGRRDEHDARVGLGRVSRLSLHLEEVRPARPRRWPSTACSRASSRSRRRAPS